jgi:hypothetical protein
MGAALFLSVGNCDSVDKSSTVHFDFCSENMD